MLAKAAGLVDLNRPAIVARLAPNTDSSTHSAQKLLIDALIREASEPNYVNSPTTNLHLSMNLGRLQFEKEGQFPELLGHNGRQHHTTSKILQKSCYFI